MRDFRQLDCSQKLVQTLKMEMVDSSNGQTTDVADFNRNLFPLSPSDPGLSLVCSGYSEENAPIKVEQCPYSVSEIKDFSDNILKTGDLMLSGGAWNSDVTNYFQEQTRKLYEIESVVTNNSLCVEQSSIIRQTFLEMSNQLRQSQ